MTKLYFFVLVFLTISSCNNNEKPNQANTTGNRPLQFKDSIGSIDSKLDEKKSNFNGDKLKYSFSNNPFNYNFKDERTIDGTSDTHVQGYEDEINYQKYVELPNEILINYDLTSRQASSATFYLNHFETNNIKLKDCKKLFEFINFFAPGGCKYLQKNFKTIFYNETADEKLANYKNDAIEMIIDHNLFDARKFDKKNQNSTASQYVSCTIKFL